MTNRFVQNTILIALAAIAAACIVFSKLAIIQTGVFIIISYIVLFICIWMLLSLNMMRNAISGLYDVPTDRRVETFTNLMGKTIGVVTLIGKQNLIDVYTHVITLKQVKYSTKVKLFELYENKYITVDYPAIPKRRANGIAEL